MKDANRKILHKKLYRRIQIIRHKRHRKKKLNLYKWSIWKIDSGKRESIQRVKVSKRRGRGNMTRRWLNMQNIRHLRRMY